MVSSVSPHLRYDRVTTKLTDTSKTTVLEVGAGRLSGFSRVNLLALLISDSTGAVNTDVDVFFTDSSNSDTEYTLVNGLDVPVDFPAQWLMSPALPLFDGDTVKVTGGNGHHVVAVCQIVFDPANERGE